MIIFLIISLMCLTSAGTLAARVGVEKRALKFKDDNPEAIEPKKEQPELTRPGKRVRDDFNELPATHRPDVDIYEICRALDVKFKNTDLNDHFSKYENNGWDYYYRWQGWRKCACVTAAEPTGKPCPFEEYILLGEQISELHSAVREQERVLELAEHQNGLSEGKTLMAILDDSVHVVRSVTAEVAERVDAS